MSAIIQQVNPQAVSIAVNEAQAAGTYDLATATGGDILIRVNKFYQITAGATFTSAAIQTNDTTAFAIMTAAEGALANLTAAKQIPTANSNTPFVLKSGKKIQLTMAGSTGTGTGTLALEFVPLSGGAYLA